MNSSYLRFFELEKNIHAILRYNIVTDTYFEEECTEGMEIYGGLNAAPPSTCFLDDAETETYKMIMCNGMDSLTIMTYSDSDCMMVIDDDDDGTKMNMSCMMDHESYMFMTQEVSCPDCNSASTFVSSLSYGLESQPVSWRLETERNANTHKLN